MKNFFNLALGAVTTCLSMASCSNDVVSFDPADDVTNRTPVHTLKITDVYTDAMMATTRADVTEVNAWADAPTKDVGVSVYKTVSGDELLREDGKNLKYSYNSTWSSTSPMGLYYEDQGFLSAYYPYLEDADPKAITIDASKDWMYAPLTDNKPVSYYSPSNSLTMHHANAQIIVNLVRNGYTGTGAVTEVTASSNKFASSATLNTLTGELSSHVLENTLASDFAGNLAEDISTSAEAKVNVLHKWFVPVDDGNADVVAITMKIDGYTYRFKKSMELKKGNKYIFTLSVKQTDKVLSLSNITINTWTNLETSGQIKEYIELVGAQEKIDMGLSSGLLWAAGNVGATDETEPGLYFAWGETTGHEKGSGYSFSSDNYNAGSAASISANLTLEKDAAHAYLGGNWRMPTADDFQELINECNTTWVTDYKNTGVNGRLFTSKTNGNTLFFPAAGYYNGSSLDIWGSFGYYWSSSFYGSSDAYFFRFDCYEQETRSNGRYYGFSVRGVCQ